MYPSFRRDSFPALCSSHLAFLMPGVISLHSTHSICPPSPSFPCPPHLGALPSFSSLHSFHSLGIPDISAGRMPSVAHPGIHCFLDHTFFHSGMSFMVKSVPKQVFKKEGLLNKMFHPKDASNLLVGLVSCPGEHRIWDKNVTCKPEPWHHCLVIFLHPIANRN